MAQQPKGFTFFETYYEALRGLNNVRFGSLIKAVCEYAFHDVEPQFADTTLNAFWILIRPNVDCSIKRSLAGKKGMQSRYNKTPNNPDNKTPNNPDNKAPNDKDKVKDKVEDKVEDKDKDKDKEKEKKEEKEKEEKEQQQQQTREDEKVFLKSEAAPANLKPAAVVAAAPFRPPTEEEVRRYCEAKAYTFDPAYFFQYYQTKGWHMGKSPMQSWQAAADFWQLKVPEFINHQKQTTNAQSPISRQDLEERDRQRRYAHYAEFMRASLAGELDPDPNTPLPF